MSNHPTYTLGIDLGVASIGWAAITTENNRPVGVLAAGVRVFDAGVTGGLAKIEQGRDESNNKVRREARLRRRQLERRARRKRVIFTLLQQGGLLPEGLDRTKILNEIDRTLTKKYESSIESPGSDAVSFLPYFLRARGLDHALERAELGRALYHLAQRRGFLSNRKTAARDDEKENSQVKSAISELEQDMLLQEARTLGEYFAKHGPTGTQIRRRWTARSMYRHEFAALIDAQATLAPDVASLLDVGRRWGSARRPVTLAQALERAFFHQRPLKGQRHLVGHCEIEPKQRRAPYSDLLSQRFRLLQSLNHLSAFNEETGEIVEFGKADHADRRRLLLAELETKSEVSFDRARRVVFPKQSGWTFNLERGGEKRLKGDDVTAKMLKVFGKSWNSFDASTKAEAIHDLRSIEKDGVLERRGRHAWNLDGEALKTFVHTTFEDGYSSLSRKAMRRIMPFLERGMPYANACDAAYPHLRATREALANLPPLNKVTLPSVAGMRNPAVSRSLTELRKVVNALIREYGKPQSIHIELARDLKNPRKKREAMWSRNRKNETDRSDARTALERGQGDEGTLQSMGISNPREGDILKYRLAVECGWQCPYTGKIINFEALFHSSQFDVEHIIPLSRSLDDSFANKTLCHHEFNRNTKLNKTPYEALHGRPEWSEIIDRVRRFRGGAAREKWARFQMTPEEVNERFSDFSARHLNDTRYASRVSGDYLGLLFGGRSDREGVLRIQTSNGSATAKLRNVWGLNSILDDGGNKTREDHRHHVVDAIVIALTTTTVLRQMSVATRNNVRADRFPKSLPRVWNDFDQDVRKCIEGLRVSHRPEHKLSGGFHQDTVYSRPLASKDGTVHHLRKPVATLSAGEIERIVDPTIRQIVLAKYTELGEKSFKKLGVDSSDWPRLRSKRHPEGIPIKRVRIRDRGVCPRAVGEQERQRLVLQGANHHIAVFEVIDEKGQVKKWEGVLVSLFDAYLRKQRGEPIVQRDAGPGRRFLFSIMNRDVLQMGEEDKVRLVRVIGLTHNGGYPQISVAEINDAKTSPASPERTLINGLMKRATKKVRIDPIGRLFQARD